MPKGGTCVQHLRVQMDAQSRQLKNESKSEIFSGPGNAQESVNGTTINALMCPWWYNVGCSW